MKSFFQDSYEQLVESPNGKRWWHSLPLPDGNRISGYHEDKAIQLKMWQGLQIASDAGLAGKRVLDIGANDGFFSIAALMAGAESATSMDMGWGTNLAYSAEVWGVSPTIVQADFRTYDWQERYDVVFFLGVLYHLEDVFNAMRLLRSLLADGGSLYIETQMSQIQSELPVFECASDIYPTVAPQSKEQLDDVGFSNHFFPNAAAMHNLAHSLDFEYECLAGPDNPYSSDYPDRQLFLFQKPG